MIAFSTTNITSHFADTREIQKTLIEENSVISGLFQAVVESVEEAVINSLFQAHTVVGRNGHTVRALPIDVVLDILKG